MRIAGAVIAIVFAAVAADAVTIVPGDVAVTMLSCRNACVATPPPPTSYLLGHGLISKSLRSGYYAAFGPNGHLFASNGASVTEYDTTLTAVQTFTRPNGSTAALTVAANGNLFVMSFGGVLTIYSPAGAVLQTISLPFTGNAAGNLDLGPDQCTLFYTDGARTGRRYDVCTQQPLTNLAPGPWNAVRAMSDGGYAAASNSTLSIFDAQNHLLRAYTPPVDEILALAFDSDPGFILLGTVRGIQRLRLADGVITDSFLSIIVAVAVNGEQRAASAPLSTGIPTLSPALLFAVALGLTALGWQRLRV
ncbi:MAG TPA: hypothetical protein VJZ76_03725 [Thermoanaerobaculia bacterium]|nr:hypothetical protein [Thermoanaerobaculia bacterium]